MQYLHDERLVVFSYTNSRLAAEHSYWLIITLLENRKKIYEKLLRLLETWPLRGGAYGILEIILKIDNMCLGPLCFLHLMVYKNTPRTNKKTAFNAIPHR